MKNQEIETFMTYEDWKKLYKHNLKKYLKNKIKYCVFSSVCLWQQSRSEW